MSELDREMRSATLLGLLRRFVAEELPDLLPADADKPALLSTIHERLGPAAVVAAGQGLCALPEHPVLVALARGSEPLSILERWQCLERFGHTRHRTRLSLSSRSSVLLEHYATDGGAIHPLNDLFVWGVVVALLARAGVAGLSASLEQRRGGPVAIFEADELIVFEELPEVTSLLRLAWREVRAHLPPPAALESRGAVEAALAATFRSDLVHAWKVEEAARRLGLSIRGLQRKLAQVGSSFSEVLQRTRVDAARELMEDARLSLGEIAFCVGFSDQAHFTRVFRRYLDVPPSTFREITKRGSG